MNRHKIILNITLSGLFIALGLLLPFLTGQIPEIGSMLCPMHIPVLICGFICGWKYGLIVGAITPILRSVIFQMPPMYPTALSMAFELGTYGFVSGFIYNVFMNKDKNNILYTFLTLIIAMLSGRIVWGIIRYLLALIDGSYPFNISIFLSGAFITAWPGIILQLILIPTLIITLQKTNILKKES